MWFVQSSWQCYSHVCAYYYKIPFLKISTNLFVWRVQIFMILIPTITSLLIELPFWHMRTILDFFSYLAMELIQYILIVSLHVLAWLWIPFGSGNSCSWNTYCQLFLEMQPRAPVFLWAGRWGLIGKRVFEDIKSTFPLHLSFHVIFLTKFLIVNSTFVCFPLTSLNLFLSSNSLWSQ